MQEAALLQIAAQGAQLDIGEVHVPMAGHIDVRDVPELRPGQGHDTLAVCDGEGRARAQRGQQIGEARRVRVPVAAAVVMEAADCEISRAWWVVRRAWLVKQY